MEKETLKKLRLPNVQTARVDIGWFIVDAYLDGLAANAAELFGDEEYKKLFDALRSYTDRMLYDGDENNIIDIHVTVYRENIDK